MLSNSVIVEDMETSAPRTARERARAELTQEIKTTAKRHLGEQGASSLSLRAVARELGMASSAVYRYFPSRDMLLTALIVDAYDSLGAAAEIADAAERRGDLSGRWMSVCKRVREWAIENPHEYALIFGSPVPGYIAPPDTSDPATRTSVVFLGILAGVETVRVADSSGGSTSPELGADLDRIVALGDESITRPMMMEGLAAWMQVFGMISFELFGHLNTVISDYEVHYRQQCASLAVRLALTDSAADLC